MIWGLPTPTFTLLHVVISLIAIVSGVFVIFGMFRSQPLRGWTAAFIVTTALTSLTGFLFPNSNITPAQIFGFLSLGILVVTFVAFYVLHLAGAARWIYAAGAVSALYLNVFVLVAQAFAKVPVLRAFAPTQSEPPFLVAETIVLGIFVVLGITAILRFHPEVRRASERQEIRASRV